jgi:6-phosphogluconate dehydrogenase
MREAAKEYGWKLNNGGIALMWRGGCIIRSVFLGKIKEAFDTDPALVNLLLAPFFTDAVETAQAGWRRVIMKSVELGIPMPAISAALGYFDGYRAARLPANLLQAQRDYFGAHTYERVDQPRGQFFHTNWTGRGGDTAASTYIV